MLERPNEIIPGVHASDEYDPLSTLGGTAQLARSSLVATRGEPTSNEAPAVTISRRLITHAEGL
jgi:hypothetical protein